MKSEVQEERALKAIDLTFRRPRLSFRPTALKTSLQYTILVVFLLIGFFWKWQGLAHLDPLSYHRYSYEALNYSDIISLYLRDERATHNLVPFIQQNLEYPVLTGLAIWLAGLAGNAQGYFSITVAFLGASAVISLWLIKRMPGSQAWMWAAAPALLWYSALNWDLLSICPALAAIYLVRYKQRPGWAGVLLAVAIWSRFFPVMLVVSITLYYATQRQWHALSRYVSTLLITSLAINLPVLLLNPAGWAYFFSFNQQRRIEAGLWFLIGPHLSIGVVNTASLLFFAIFSGALCAWFGWRGWKGRAVVDPALLALLLFCAWFSLNKVYSPQYILWLLALLAVIGIPGWLYTLMCCLDALYYLGSFQTLYFIELVKGDRFSLAGQAILEWQFHPLHNILTVLRLGLFALLLGVTLWQDHRKGQLSLHWNEG